MRFGQNFDLTTLLIVLGILVVCLIILAVARRRRRSDPDRGGHGYTPTATPTPAAPARAPADALDGEERLLLGIAAPRAVFAEADPFAWDLGGAHGGPEWRDELARAERALEAGSSAASRIAAAVDAAWWIRVGVSRGQLGADEARRRTRAIGEAVRRDAADWFAFGDLLGERPGCASPRELYRAGAPWAEPEWP